MNSSDMIIYSGRSVDAADLPLTWIDRDWYGEGLSPPVGFAFGLDLAFFHFVARRKAPARCHPESKAGQFQAELWTHDVAEFFLGTAHGYLEFNLAPNGGWWTCEFDAPRKRRLPDDLPLPGVHTTSVHDQHGWQVAARIPRAWLEERYPLAASGLNATFILESPHQRFLTAGPPGSGEPDFHRPSQFPCPSIRSAAGPGPGPG